jgi:hypothetical protein
MEIEMSKKQEKYNHLSLVILIVFLLVLGCAAGAIGVSVIPSWVEHEAGVSK